MIRSGLIETRQEAVDYFAARIAGTYDLLCYRKPVRVRIPREGTHFYSEEVATPFALAKGERVVRRMAGGREEVRAFSLDRARLLDHMIPAIERFHRLDCRDCGDRP